MCDRDQPLQSHPSKYGGGFTLVEVMIAVAILGLVFGGMIGAYTQSANRAEWSGYSLAAQALALQYLEQARSAKWDVTDTPTVDEMTNLPRIVSTQLDLPVSGTNQVYVTNYVTITTIPIATNPTVVIHMVQVATVWPFLRGSRTIYFTNVVANYFAPDR